MYVYLQAYEEGATVAKPLVAFVSFYKGSNKGLRDAADRGDAGGSVAAGMVPLNFTIGLKQLPPGQYDCQVTVLDPTDQKSTFWSSPVMIVP